MNIIDIILLIILAIAFISGMQKGFLTSLMATFAFVCAWLIALSVGPALSARFMGSQFQDWLNANIPFDDLLTPIGVNNQLCMNLGGQIENVVTSLTEGGVPTAVVDAFRTNIGSFGHLTVSQYLSETVWRAAFNVVSFVIAFGISYALLLLFVNLINNVFRVPKLRGVDALLGGILGSVRGYVIICLALAVIPMLFTALDSEMIQNLFNDSNLGGFFLNSKSVFADLFGVGDMLKDLIASR